MLFQICACDRLQRAIRRNAGELAVLGQAPSSHGALRSRPFAPIPEEASTVYKTKTGASSQFIHGKT